MHSTTNLNLWVVTNYIQTLRKPPWKPNIHHLNPWWREEWLMPIWSWERHKANSKKDSLKTPAQSWKTWNSWETVTANLGLDPRQKSWTPFWVEDLGPCQNWHIDGYSSFIHICQNMVATEMSFQKRMNKCTVIRPDDTVLFCCKKKWTIKP